MKENAFYKKNKMDCNVREAYCLQTLPLAQDKRAGTRKNKMKKTTRNASTCEELDPLKSVCLFY